MKATLQYERGYVDGHRDATDDCLRLCPSRRARCRRPLRTSANAIPDEIAQEAVAETILDSYIGIDPNVEDQLSSDITTALVMAVAAERAAVVAYAEQVAKGYRHVGNKEAAWILEGFIETLQRGQHLAAGQDDYECDGISCPPRAHDHKVLE